MGHSTIRRMLGKTARQLGRGLICPVCATLLRTLFYNELDSMIFRIVVFADGITVVVSDKHTRTFFYRACRMHLELRGRNFYSFSLGLELGLLMGSRYLCSLLVCLGSCWWIENILAWASLSMWAAALCFPNGSFWLLLCIGRLRIIFSCYELHYCKFYWLQIDLSFEIFLLLHVVETWETITLTFIASGEKQ